MLTRCCRNARLARLLAAVAAVALLASCSPTKDKVSTETVTRSLPFNGCDQVPCSGEIGGAPYQIRLPATWNGTLLLYSHGYRHSRPVPPDFAPIENEPLVAPDDRTANALLADGYALAGSAYARNGWAVEEGMQAGEDLYAWFRAKVGAPDRVYVWGESLGGLITQTLAERHPDWVSGSVPMCGVLAGLNPNLDLALDLQYAVKTLLYPEMQLVGFASHEAAVATFLQAQQRIVAAAQDPDEGIPALLTIAAVVDIPARTAKFDGSTPESKVSAVVEGILTELGYATFSRYEIEQRVRGNPSTNATTNYLLRFSPLEKATAEALAPGALEQAVRALMQGERVTANAQARAYADRLGNPTGRLQDPVVTLHTAFDPLVLVQNESVFAGRVVNADGRRAGLVQLYTVPPRTHQATAPYGAGHCNFTVDERVGAIRSLDRWVRERQLPTPDTVREAMRGAKGYNPEYRPGPWPAG